MKLLLLLRHADSAEKMQGQTDHERTLTSKGVQQVAQVAAFINDKSLRPDKIIASNAVRVRTTVELLFKETTSSFNQTDFIDQLYEADTETYLDVVRGAGNCQTLLIVGHNPAISAFATHISRTRIGDIGTANFLVFQFKESSWESLDKGQCELMEHYAP